MKFLLYAILIVAMTLAVPWFFTAEPAAADVAVKQGSGLPNWVWYVIGASVLYAALVAVFIHFFWENSADDESLSAEQADGGTN